MATTRPGMTPDDNRISSLQLRQRNNVPEVKIHPIERMVDRQGCGIARGRARCRYFEMADGRLEFESELRDVVSRDFRR